MLQNIETGKLTVTRDSPESEALQHYFNVTTRHISRWESKSEDLIEDREIARIARLSEDLINPGRRDALLRRLQQLGIRRNIFDKVESYTRDEQDVPASISMGNDRMLQIMVGRMVMGDEINVTGEQQIGSIGGRIKKQTVRQERGSSQPSDDIDLHELAQALTELRKKLKDQATEVDQYAALGQVAEAKKAAEEQDKPRTLEHLRNAGEWVLARASEIGVPVAVAATKAAMGLP